MLSDVWSISTLTILKIGKKKKKKVCFPLSMFCVSDHREEFPIKVGTRKRQVGKWMYHTLWEANGTTWMLEYIYHLVIE